MRRRCQRVAGIATSGGCQRVGRCWPALERTPYEILFPRPSMMASKITHERRRSVQSPIRLRNHRRGVSRRREYQFREVYCTLYAAKATCCRRTQKKRRTGRASPSIGHPCYLRNRLVIAVRCRRIQADFRRRATSSRLSPPRANMPTLDGSGTTDELK